MLDLDSIYNLFVRLIAIQPLGLVVPLVVLVLLVAIIACLIFKRKEIGRSMLLGACAASLIILAISGHALFHQYLLASLDAEDDSAASWAYHRLSSESLSDDWYISILNDKRESEYVRFYVAQIIATRLQHDSQEQQDLVLDRLNNAPEVSQPHPFTTTDENRNTQKIAFPVPAKELVTQLMASTN